MANIAVFSNEQRKSKNCKLLFSMKPFVTLILLISTLSLSAQDTLRHYKANRLWANSYSPTTYPKLFARFEPTAPATIKSILVTLSGNTGGTAKLHLYGHEGGTSHPQLKADYFTPITFTKTTSDDDERIEINLDSLNIRVENNQFFVGITDMDNVRVRVGLDAVNPSCSTSPSTGGDFLYTTAENSQGQWALNANRVLAIDIVLTYDPLPATPWFVDADSLSGIKSGGRTNGNVAFGNINNDSHTDVLVGKRLFINTGAGTFTDVSAIAGIDYAVNPAANMFIDMDNDGDDDILFLSHDANQNYLYINNGDNTFTKKQITDFPKFESITAFNIADINNDGFPDMFIAQLWQPYGTTQPNYLFINNGSLSFTDETTRLGGNTAGFSRGSQWVDYDNDGDLDLYVANYAASLDRSTSYDNFFRNKGDGTFENIISQTPIDNNNGTIFYNMSTGCDWADYDNDGDMDLLHSNFSHPRNMPPVQYSAPWGTGGSNITVKEDTRMTTLFANEGAPNYTFKNLVGQVSQLAGQISPIGLQLEETHANAAFGDLNNDGLPDIVTTTYYGCNFNDVYIQQPDNTFKLKTFHYGLNKVKGGENATFADYDNDGKLDLLIGNGGNFRFYKNNALHGGNYVSIELKATTGNKNAIGSRVAVWTDGKRYMQDVVSGRGIKSQKPHRLFFGMGKHKQIDSVVVYWYGKQASEVFSNVAINNVNYLSEGGQVSLSNPKINANNTALIVSPNPFTKNVSFSFLLTKNQRVQLQVFDALGRKVYSTKHTFAAGQQTLNCEKGMYALAKGIYTYRLQIGDAHNHSGILVKQ
jgi:hypothetical protein